MTNDTQADDARAMVEVTQADREAAAALAEWHNRVAGEWESVNGGTMQWFTAGFPAGVRCGTWDEHDLVQAFARHRLATTQPKTSEYARAVEGGRPAGTEPAACCVLAGRFDESVGEWVMAVVSTPLMQPFTTWWPLPGALTAETSGIIKDSKEKDATIAQARLKGRTDAEITCLAAAIENTHKRETYSTPAACAAALRRHVVSIVESWNRRYDPEGQNPNLVIPVECLTILAAVNILIALPTAETSEPATVASAGEG